MGADALIDLLRDPGVVKVQWPVWVIDASGRKTGRMTAEKLAKAAGVSKVTLSDFEIGKRTPHPRTLAAIRAALESAGVEFTNGEQPGVRLRKTK